MPIKSIFRNVLKKVNKPQTGWLDIFPAIIGREDGIVLTSTPGEIYVRNVLNGQTLTVVNNNAVPNTINLQVEVGRRVETPGLWQVKGQRQTFKSPASKALVPYHKDQHIFPAADAPIFPRKQIRELTVLVASAENFIVQVYGDVGRGADGYFLIDSQTVDLSGYVPATGALYVNIETDESGVLTVHVGDNFLSPDLASAAAIPVPVAGKYRIATIILYEDMPSLNDANIQVASSMLEGAGGGGGGVESVTGDGVNNTDPLNPAIFNTLKHYATVVKTTALPAYTHSAGGVLTGNSTGTLSIDSHTVALNEYVLVAGETGGNQKYNGLYKCTTAGAVGVAYVLTRDVDMNSNVSPRLMAMVITAAVGDQYSLILYGVYSIGTYTVDSSDVYVQQVYATMSIRQDAQRIANGSVDNTEFQYLNGVTSAIQTQLNGKQPTGSYLTAANIEDSINDAITDKAPSENAVFDALALKQNSLGFTAENVANKDTDGTLTANSDTKYASQKATKTYADAVSSNASVIAKVLTAFAAGAGTVSAADSILSAFQKVVGNIALKLTANAPITGATKTKITYDANGLVTAGADATTSDIADSTNKRYVTDDDLNLIRGYSRNFMNMGA